jgi:hypothetical protein
MLSTSGRTPKNFDFQRVQLQSIGLHPAGYFVDAAGETRLPLTGIRRAAKVGDLRVVSVEVQSKTLVVDDLR